MNFYSAWAATRRNNVDDFEFFKEFFNKTAKTLEPLECLDDECTIEIVGFLLSIPMDDFIKNILKMEAQGFKTEDVVQFSNFKHAYNELPSLLLYENRSLGYNEIGGMIMHCKNDVACKKYGENHSKLAYEMGFVSLSRKGKVYVELTSFGRVVASINSEDKYKLAMRMLTRNILVRNIILLSAKDMVSYGNLTKTILSQSTMERRKSNVKRVIENVLTNSNFMYLMDNIIW